MKKATQFSDKYGKVVTEDEVVAEREAPGVFLTAPVVDPVVEEVAEDVVVEDEVEVEDDE